MPPNMLIQPRHIMVNRRIVSRSPHTIVRRLHIMVTGLISRGMAATMAAHISMEDILVIVEDTLVIVGGNVLAKRER